MRASDATLKAPQARAPSPNPSLVFVIFVFFAANPFVPFVADPFVIFVPFVADPFVIFVPFVADPLRDLRALRG
jgi:hypothetical protein